MAISKRGSKKATQRASARRTTGRASRKATAAPKLGEGQKRELLGLEAGYEAPIEVGVADILQEARELEAACSKLGPQLVAGSKLAARDLAELPKRKALLEQAELAWAAARLSPLPDGHHASFGEAEALKKQAIVALRYFLSAEAAVQTRVDAVVPGTGVADLVDDLQKLADLLDENAAELKKAKLPKKASSLARDLARQLGEGTAEEAADTSAQDASRQAKALRDRAYWWLRELMDEIRAAGRYVFHDEPRKLAHFRSSGTHARKRQAASKGGAKPAAPSGGLGSSPRSRRAALARQARGGPRSRPGPR